MNLFFDLLLPIFMIDPFAAQELIDHKIHRPIVRCAIIRDENRRLSPDTKWKRISEIGKPDRWVPSMPAFDDGGNMEVDWAYRQSFRRYGEKLCGK
jgi:hypothetical protein